MTHDIIPAQPHALTASALQPPALIVEAGPSAAFAYDEFFGAQIANPNTLEAYRRAVHRFLAWCEARGLALTQILPSHVGTYLKELLGSPPTKKQHLAAIRRFFDQLVIRHAVVLNPASSVRGPKYSQHEGATPDFTIEQAGHLLGAIDTSHVVGLRDRAIIATLIYTAARVGAIAKLNLADYYTDSTQRVLHFAEKGGKSRHIPVRHDLQLYLDAYLQAAGLAGASGEAPLFRTAQKKVRALTSARMSRVYIWRMVKRRCKDVGLPAERLTCHSFRATTATDLLDQDVPLADVQYLLGHADPRTTRLYDRRTRQVTRNTVERISVRPIAIHSHSV